MAMASNDTFIYKVDVQGIEEATRKLDNFYDYIEDGRDVDLLDFRNTLKSIQKIKDEYAKVFKQSPNSDLAKKLGVEIDKAQHKFRNTRFSFEGGEVGFGLDIALEKFSQNINPVMVDIENRFDQARGKLRSLANQMSNMGNSDFFDVGEMQEYLSLLDQAHKAQKEMDKWSDRKLEPEDYPTALSTNALKDKVANAYRDLEEMKDYNLEYRHLVQERRKIIDDAEDYMRWDDDDLASAKRRSSDYDMYQDDISELKGYISEKENLLQRLKDSEYTLFDGDDNFERYIENVKEQIDTYKRYLSDLESFKNGGGHISTGTPIGDMKPLVKTLEEIRDKIGEISTAFKPLTDAMADGGSAFTKMLTSSADEVDGLIAKFTELLGLVDSINNKEFNMTNVISSGNNQGNDIEQIRAFRQEAKEVFKQVEDLYAESIETSKKIKGTPNGLSAFLDFSSTMADFDMSDLAKRIKSRSAASLGVVIDELNEWKRILLQFNDLRNNVDAGSFDVSRYNSTSSKVSITPKSSENDTSSVADTTRVDDNTILDKIKNLSTQVQEELVLVRSKIEETFNLATLDKQLFDITPITQSIYQQFEELQKNVANLKFTIEATPTIVDNGALKTTNNNGIKTAEDAIRAEGEAATEATPKKNAFVEANKKVAESMQNTGDVGKTAADGIKEEGNAAERAAEQINSSLKAIDDSVGKKPISINGTSYEDFKNFAMKLASSNNMKIDDVSVVADGDDNARLATIKMVNEELAQSVVYTYRLKDTEEDGAVAYLEKYKASSNVNKSLKQQLDIEKRTAKEQAKNHEWLIRQQSKLDTRERRYKHSKKNIDGSLAIMSTESSLGDTDATIDSLANHIRERIKQSISSGLTTEAKEAILNDLRILENEIAIRQNEKYSATTMKASTVQTNVKAYKEYLNAFEARAKKSNVFDQMSGSIQELRDNLDKVTNSTELDAFVEKLKIARNKLQAEVAKFGQETKSKNFDLDFERQYGILVKQEAQWKKNGQLTDDARIKIEQMLDALTKVTNSTELAQWKKQWATVKDEIIVASVKLGELNGLYEKQAKYAANIYRLQEQLKSGKLGTEMTADVQRRLQVEQAIYDSIQKQIDGYGSLVDNTKREKTIEEERAKVASEIATVNAKETDKETARKNKANQNYGKSTYNSLNRKYEKIVGQIGTLEVTNPQVLAQFDAFKQKFLEVEKLRSRFENDPNAKNDPILVAEFQKVAKEADNAYKEIKEVLDVSEQLQNISKSEQILPTTSLDDIAGVDNQSKIQNYINSIKDGKVQIKSWNADHTKAYIAIDRGRGIIDEATVAIDKSIQSMGAYRTATENVGTAWDKLKAGVNKKFREVVNYAIGGASMYAAFNKIRQGVQYVKEIDLALTELKKVTSETDATYQKFLKTASQTAAKVGSTVKDVVSSAADWSRLGYSIAEATQLAESTQVLMNVSEFTDVSSATDSLISSIQAFKYTAEESMGVVDILNTIGNNYAISTADLAQSLTKSSGSLVAANGTLEEAVALTATANTIIQNADVVGTALKTVAMRLRGTSVNILSEEGLDTDGAIESISKLQSKIKALSGVDILTDTGSYKSTYQILAEIAEVWKDISDIDQAALLEVLAGKRAGSVMAAILQNPETLKDAFASAQDASGSALKENEKYLDSIQGKIDRFTNSVQTMWMNLIDSELIKDLVDLGKTLVGLADKIGVVRIAFMAMGTYLSMKFLKIDWNVDIDKLSKSFVNLFKSLKSGNGVFESIKTAFSNTSGNFATVSENLNSLIQKYENAKAAYVQNPTQENEMDLAAAEKSLNIYRKQTESVLKLEAAKMNLSNAEKALAADSGKNAEITKQLSEDVEKYKTEVQELEKAQQSAGTTGSVAWGRLKVSAKAFAKQLQQTLTSMATMYLISKVIEGIVWVFDKLIETAEESKEKFDNLVSELDSTKSGLDDLESKLEDINKQIEEINDNTPLSFTDQEDLKRLKAESAELEQQIKFQKMLAEQQQEKVNQEAVKQVKQYKKTVGDSGKTSGEIVGESTLTGAGIGLAAGMTGFGAAIGGAIKGAVTGSSGGPWGAVIGAVVGLVVGAIGGAIAGGVKANKDETVGATLENMDENYANLEKKMIDARNKALKTGSEEDQEAYEKAQENFTNFKSNVANYFTEMGTYFDNMDMATATESEKAAYEEYKTLQDKWAIINNGDDAVKNALDRLFGEDADEVVKAYANLAKNAIEAGESFDFTEADAGAIGLDDDLEALGLTTKNVTDYFITLGEVGADAIEEIDVSDLVSELAKIEGALESLQSVMEEFRTNGIISASTLNGMDEEFKGLGEAWENYVNTMMSGTATMADVKVATEELAKAYLDKNANNIKDNKLTYIAQLEKLGIENAAELVNSYLQNSFWNSSEFEKFKGGYEELIELAEEYGISLEGITEAEANALLAAKENAKTTANTRDQQIKAAEDKKYELEKNRQYAVDNYLYNNLVQTAYQEAMDIINKSGAYTGISDEQAQDLLNDKIEYLRNSFGSGYYDPSTKTTIPAEEMINALFPDMSVVPEITVSQEEVAKAKREYQEKLDQMGLSVTPTIDINPADTIDEISDVESGLEGLSSAYNEFLEEGVVSAGTLAGLKDTFDVVGMKDEYAKLVTTLGNSNSTIEEVKASLLDLANAYLNTIDVTDQMDESEKQMIIEQLTRLGVENAEAWVNTRINAYKEISKAYQIDLNNYNTAEEAKAAAAITRIFGIEALNDDLIRELLKDYGDDLAGFTSGEKEKVEAAKEAAKKIAQARRVEQIEALGPVSSHPGDAALREEWARKAKEINDKYYATLDAIDKVGTIDPNDYIDSWFGGGTNIDFGKFEGLGDGSDSSTELDWLDHYFTDIENKIKEGEARLENVISADTGGLDNKNTIIDEIIGLYKDKESLLENAKNAYLDRATRLYYGFDKDIQDKIDNGSTIDPKEYDSETAEDIQNYFDYITKANDLEIELGSVKVTVADFSLQKFDNVATAFDNEIEEKFQSDQDVIEAEIGYLEEQGKRVSPELYTELIKIQEKEQGLLEEKKKTLENILAAEVAAGRVPVYSEQWYEMKSAINEVDEALIQGKNDIEAFKNSINEIYWDNFEKLIGQIDAVNSELSNLFDLLSEDDKVVDEFGNWTDEGIASLGLLAQQMENAQAKANEYKQAMDDLKENKANYSIDEFNEKMDELKENYLSEIKNVEDLKDAMVDLNKVRIDSVKEAIDKEIEALEEKNEKLKESLDLEKEQYEWQKSVAEKEKSIADIQRRLNALAGDNSASAIAERRKLQAELAQAQQEMDDMWYEHGIEEQQKSLDDSLENYKENKEDEKEALDKWLEDEEKVIQASFDLFNSNVDLVSSVLKAFEEEHGIKLTEAITNPWNSGIDAMTAYRDELEKMKQEQEDAKHADAVQSMIDTIGTVTLESEEDIKAARAAYDALTDAQKGMVNIEPLIAAETALANLKNAPPPPPPIKDPDPDSNLDPDPKSPPANGSTVTVKKSATNFSRDAGNGTKMQPWVPGSSFTVYGSDSDEVLIGKNGGYTGWVKLSDIEGYYKGTTGVKDDQWAFTDELGPELTLHAGPNGRLQYLTKGSGVVTADLTKRLMEWGELDPSQVLKNSAPKLGAPHITTNNMEINLRINEVVHIDHADSNSIQDITSAVQKQMDQYMKNVNQSLKRFAR